MEILINPELRIKTLDCNNIGLQKLGKTKKGDQYWRNISYYGSLSSLLSDMIDSPILLIDIKDINEYKSFLNKIVKTKKEMTS